ncbi:MAG TPA: hypothetical protein VLM19_05650 [Nitrospiraceae bacterium]|nr:hypothetical protein [Nitrospiraceae bacterium]
MSFLNLCVNRHANAAHGIRKIFKNADLLLTNMLPTLLPPAPLEPLPVHFKIASLTLRMFLHIAGLLAFSNGQESPRYGVRLRPWRLAQYDPAIESLMLRQSLQDAGLEPFFWQIFRERQTT